MSTRTRIIYPCLGVFVGPTGALASGESLLQIQRVQTENHSLSVSRTDVNQYGKLGLLDRVILNAPTTNLTFEALLVNAINANRLGLDTDGSKSCISSILSGITDTKNYYVALASEGSDLIGTTGNGAFGFGNGFISNISFKGAVGEFAKESYTIEALNQRVYSISSGNVPTVNPVDGQNITGVNFAIPIAVTGTATSISALQPGDITVTLSDTFGFATSELHIQNFDITLPLAREDIKQLGTKFAFAKVITFPVTVTATFSTVAGSIANANLADKLCNDTPVDLTITLKQPDCSGNGVTAIQFTLKTVKLDSTNFTSSIGANASVDFNYSTQLGGPQDFSIGLFISGISS